MNRAASVWVCLATFSLLSSACRQEFTLSTLDRVVIEGEERWAFSLVDGAAQAYAMDQDSQVEDCLYRWRFEGPQLRDLDTCATCAVVWKVTFEESGGVPRESECPSSAEVWPHPVANVGVVAMKPGEELACQQRRHVQDVLGLMDDPVPHIDRFALVGADPHGSWDDSCFNLGWLDLAVDRYTGDLVGAYESTYTAGSWDYVYLWGSVRAIDRE